MTVRVLFVCLGNLCRSPMAEAVFGHMVTQAGLTGKIRVDSAGTGAWHVGEPPHAGTMRILRDHGITYRHTARVVTAADFTAFDYIIAMDSDNLYTLRGMARGGPQPKLLLEYAPNLGVREVPDPYYTNRFAESHRLIEAGCHALLRQIIADHRLSAS